MSGADEKGAERAFQYKRLQECAETLAKGDNLDGEDAVWLAGILETIGRGEDVRNLFFAKTRRGRPTTSDTREFWMTVEARAETATTGKRGKALWAMLGKKWGCSDGSVKNAIARNRSTADAMIESIGLEEAIRVARIESPEHKNSRN